MTCTLTERYRRRPACFDNNPDVSGSDLRHHFYKYFKLLLSNTFFHSQLHDN